MKFWHTYAYMHMLFIRQEILCSKTICTATHCNTLQHTATHCNILQLSATHCNSWIIYSDSSGNYKNTTRKLWSRQGVGHPIWLQRISIAGFSFGCVLCHCVAVSCSELQWVAVCCNVLQCVAMCCSVLQCVAGHIIWLQKISDAGFGCRYVQCCSVLKCDAVCCSVLQCVGVCCSVLECVAVCCSVLQCVAVCCSVLECVAVCRSVLQCVGVCCSVFFPGESCDERVSHYTYELVETYGLVM